VVKKEVHAGTEPKSNVDLTFTGPATFSEPEQLRFYALVDVMNIRITDILREKLTLIYGGGMQGNLTKLPYAHYAISTSLPCGPENVDKVLAALTGEIRAMQEHGPAVADLNKVKENWLQQHAKMMRENGYWLARLQNALLNGTDPHTILSYEKDVAALTPDDIRTAARHYLNLQNYVQVVLYPQAASAAAAGTAQDKAAAH
jgi:zinc protease